MRLHVTSEVDPAGTRRAALQLMIGRCVLRAIRADQGRVLVGFDGLEGPPWTRPSWPSLPS